MTEEMQDWTRVREEEAARIRTREALLRKIHKCTCRFPPNRVGMALSGGGIRSATFSLGLMRSLSAQRLVHCLDYLSTVSGGGYTGAFYCSLFVPSGLRGPAPPPEEEGEHSSAHVQWASGHELEDGAACDVLGTEKGRRAISQLRQGGHYLAPNGTSDALFAGVIAIRNWFAVAITTGLGLLALFFAVNLIVSAVTPLLKVPPDLYGTLLHVSPASQPAFVWVVTLAALAFWPASTAWAYWFTSSGHVRLSRIARLFSMQSFVALLIVILALWWPPQGPMRALLLKGIATLAASSFLTYAAAELVSFYRDRSAGATRAARTNVEALAQEDRVRNRLSRWLLRGTIVFGAVAAVAAFHLWSRNLLPVQGPGASALEIDERALIVGAVVVAAILAVRSWFKHGSEFRGSRRARFASERARHLASLIAGTVLLVIFVGFWAMIAGGASAWIENNPAGAWKKIGDVAPQVIDFIFVTVLQPRGLWFDSTTGAHLLLALLALKVGIIAYLLGNVDPLLNRSSLFAFYSGRLRSAYLGATNERRLRRDNEPGGGGHNACADFEALDRDDPNDEIRLKSYYSLGVTAPIHLINVTINETTSSSSRVIQRDRKGKSLTVAPCGYLFPPRSPSEPLEIVRRTDAEDLPLSAWMAISGAAFTTGAGHHTSLGTAMLATLTNMRLGYWWHPRSPEAEFPLRPVTRLVQWYLLREFRASYEGTNGSRWYLSDGGHYENTGIYELVRRRIPFIIASDNGADPHYEFADLVNLIRKVRIDFDTELKFLDANELNTLFPGKLMRQVFGTLDDIRESGKEEVRAAADSDERQSKAGPYATLARILYPAEAGEEAFVGTLLLIKPRITGSELPDLIQYRDANTAFPQQPTTNQFFDEAQWESYFRLGQLIGETIFDKERYSRDTATARWEPWKMEPLPIHL